MPLYDHGWPTKASHVMIPLLYSVNILPAGCTIRDTTARKPTRCTQKATDDVAEYDALRDLAPNVSTSRIGETAVPLSWQEGAHPVLRLGARQQRMAPFDVEKHLLPGLNGHVSSSTVLYASQWLWFIEQDDT